MRASRILVVAIAVVLLVVGAACGDDDTDETTVTPGASETPAPTESNVTTIGDLTIAEPFARGAIDRGAVFFTVTNDGQEDDALVGATSDFAQTVELHETVTEGASTMMRPVDQIDVPAGGQAVLEPGGLHIMLVDPAEEISMGDTVRVTLEFEKAGSVEIEAIVTSYNTSPMPVEGSASPM